MIITYHLNQPTRSGVASNKSGPLFVITGTYLAFQLLRFTARYVAIPGRALLPHIFTLTQIALGGLFSVALAVAHPDGAFPLGSRMPFAARTFLPEGKTNRAAERFAAAKIGFSVESCKLPVIS
jgi:hypothetical protein